MTMSAPPPGHSGTGLRLIHGEASEDASAPAGDDAAEDFIPDLETLYRQHAPAVARWVARLAGPGMDAEDIVHDVFEVAQRRLEDFRGESKTSTWLYGIAIRVVQTRRRTLRLRQWLTFASLSPMGREAPSLDVADDGPTPVETLERRQLAARLYRLLDQLPEKHRTAFILFELEGLSGQEIAALTGTTVANVWVRLARARDRLQRDYRALEADRGARLSREGSP